MPASVQKTVIEILALIGLWLFWRWPLKLLDNAIAGWVDEQIAKAFDIFNPTVPEVITLAWQFFVPLVGAAITRVFGKSSGWVWSCVCPIR